MLLPKYATTKGLFFKARLTRIKWRAPESTKKQIQMISQCMSDPYGWDIPGSSETAPEDWAGRNQAASPHKFRLKRTLSDEPPTILILIVNLLEGSIMNKFAVSPFGGEHPPDSTLVAAPQRGSYNPVVISVSSGESCLGYDLDSVMFSVWLWTSSLTPWVSASWSGDSWLPKLV